MSAMLADIDATCASLGYYDGTNYIPEPDCLQSLKHLIWILRRDGDTHEYRRHLGCGKVLQTDLLPMLMHQTEENEMSDVLLRLLVNLTNPTLLLYREQLPKDGPNRRNYLHLIEILQGYKGAFSLQPVWISLQKRLQKVLGIDWAERTEEQGLLIERILVLIRNVLQVPASPDAERRADNDASLHDQVIWSLHQAGILDLVLYIVCSDHENQYHLHALEIVCLLYREQSAASLADASLQRSAAEKYRDEQELVTARRREHARINARPPPGRHSRFGGTYILQNVKSISDKDIICHQSIQRAFTMDFDRDKNQQKRSYRIVKEEASAERRSAFSIRLFLREFAIEILRSAYNTLIRQVRRVLERNSSGHDDSYLLWAIRFFMEFNRLSGFQLALVSESLSIPNFHWVLNRIQHHMDMLTMDKKNLVLWGKRLHIAIQALKELYLSLIALQSIPDESSQALFKMLQNNVCYVLEFRETTLHTLINYNESYNTKAYLRDVVEMVHIFYKMMEKFCNGRVVVQDKSKPRRKKKQTKGKSKGTKQKKSADEEREDLENMWATFAPQISMVLTNGATLTEEEQPLPFDAVADKPMDEQKDDCMVRIHNMLRQEKFEHAVVLLRSAREVWPEDDCFGAITAAPEDELMLLRDIFHTNLGPAPDTENDRASLIDGSNDEGDDDNDSNDDDDEEGFEEPKEVDFRFDDFAKRLVNPKVVRACAVVLSDWEKIPSRALKSAVTLLHRIAFGCKSPAMLYQASLFRIFQRVFDAPKDGHNEELRRLGCYIIRQFVQIAPNNPKIFAELLFYKSIREANDIENGYDGVYTEQSKKAWTEEQEDEIRQLFMENQNNPSTEKDVIDWMLDNMIEKNRTRRGVIKKLKELGLIFKAPTRKSVASSVSKHTWFHEQDMRLRELYDQHRLDENCLARVMEEFSDTRSRNIVIKRMIHLGLIADRSEILPSRRRKAKKSAGGDGSGSDEDDDDDSDGNSDSDSEAPAPNIKVTVKNVKRKKEAAIAKPSKRSVPKIAMDIAEVRRLTAALSDDEKENLEWLQESLNDAADDAEDVSEDPDDGVPLVPFSAAQRESFENEMFIALLKALGFQEPVKDMETYWRIPINMTAAEMKQRANILAGNYTGDEEQTQFNTTALDEDEDFDRLVFVDSEDDDDGGLETASDSRRDKVNTLIYNDSDDDENAPSRSPTKTAGKIADKGKPKINIFDMIKNNDDDDAESEHTEFEIDSEDIRGRLAQLLSDESDNESNNTPANVTKSKSKNNRKRIAIVDSDSDDEDNTRTPSVQQNSAVDVNRSNDSDKMNEDINSQKIRKRLAELADSDSDDEDTMLPVNTSSKSKHNSRNALIDSDESNDESTKQHGDSDGDRVNVNKDEPQKGSNKRERSVSDDSDDDSIGATKKKRTNNVSKRSAIVDSDDD